MVLSKENKTSKWAMRFSNKAIAPHEKTLKAHRIRSNVRRVLGKSSFKTFVVEPTNKLNQLCSF